MLLKKAFIVIFAAYMLLTLKMFIWWLAFPKSIPRLERSFMTPIDHQRALKCLRNKSLAFIGDSQIRDISYTLAQFLITGTVSNETSKVGKDVRDLFTTGKFRVSSFPQNFAKKRERDNSEKEFANEKYNWNIDVYHHHFQHHRWNDIKVILKQMNHKYEFVFINMGLHEKHLLPQQHVEKHVSPIADLPKNVIWLPMNAECTEKHNRENQSEIVEKANELAFTFLRNSSRRFFDVNQIIPKTKICEYSYDGVHNQFWVVQIQARVLLNQVCKFE